MRVEWDPSAAVTPLGRLPFFAELLKVSGLFDAWIEACPVSWHSNNAPNKRDVLCTAVLAILCGHWRYAHISALRGDQVNAGLLGMEKVVSEDSVRATFARMGDVAITDAAPQQVERYLAGQGPVTRHWHRKYECVERLLPLRVGPGLCDAVAATQDSAQAPPAVSTLSLHRRRATAPVQGRWRA